MKLFIDDIRNAPDETWHVVRTVTEAIRVIYYYVDDLKEISLDHDISHQVGMGDLSRPFPCGETFAGVAYFIAQVYEGRDSATIPKIVLHTSNIVGAENMEIILAKAGISCKIEMRGAASRLEMEV